MFLILCLTVGLGAQAQTDPASQSNDGKSATKETATGQEAFALPDSTKVEAIFTPKPVYPKEALEQDLQGQVVIELRISPTGAVENAALVRGEPILAKAAIEAMKKWKFKPYIKDGKSILIRIQIPYNFAFQGVDVKIKESMTRPASQRQGKPAAGDEPANDAEGGQHPLKPKVSQEVIDGLKIHDVPPVYPLAARRQHIQGDVILRATIGKDGLIHNLESLSGPPELIQAAMGAVQQWRYRPFLLKGEPVEVDTVVTVRFHL